MRRSRSHVLYVIKQHLASQCAAVPNGTRPHPTPHKYKEGSTHPCRTSFDLFISSRLIHYLTPLHSLSDASSSFDSVSDSPFSPSVSASPFSSSAAASSFSSLSPD